jgi:hypothetical protein
MAVHALSPLEHGNTVALHWNSKPTPSSQIVVNGNGPCLAAQIIALDTRVVPSRGYGGLLSNFIFISLTWPPFSALIRWYGNSFILGILPVGNLHNYTVCMHTKFLSITYSLPR